MGVCLVPSSDRPDEAKQLIRTTNHVIGQLIRQVIYESIRTDVRHLRLFLE